MSEVRTAGQNYLEQYRENQSAVIAYLNQGAELLEGWGHSEAAKPLARLRKSVEEGLFTIVLVGEFSAGKSTFLNALMHRYILPSFSGETTATVNFLRSVEKAPAPDVCGRVYRMDGSTEDIYDLSPDTLEQVVSTRGNHGDETVATTIDRVELFLDSEFLREGVQLVDSPGLNGTEDHHREITEQQIKASHASVFVFNAEHPGSNTDFEYLRDLKRESNNIFFVLNKIDCIKASEKNTAESIIQSLRGTYHERFPEETTLPKIWPVSAGFALGARDPRFEYRPGSYAKTQEKRDDLEKRSRMGEFEARLLQYLTQGERAHATLCEPVEKAIKALVEERRRLDEQISSLEKETGAEELMAKKEELEKELEKLKSSTRSISPSVSRDVKQILLELQEKAESQCAGICSKVNADLEALDLPEDIQDYATGLNSFISRRLSALANDLQKSLSYDLQDLLTTEYQNYADRIAERFAELSDETSFGLPDGKIVIQDFSSSVNLEQFDRDCAELQKRIYELSEKEEKAGMSKLAARRRERECEEAKKRLEDLRQQKQYLQNNFKLPDVEHYHDETTEKRWRGGVLGVVLTVLIGKESKKETIRREDTSKRDAAQQQYNQQMRDLEREIAAEKLREEALRGTVGISSDEAELQQNDAKRKRESLEAERKAKQEQFRRQMVESTQKETKRLRRDIRNQVDSMMDDAEKQLRSYLRSQERQMVLVVQELLNQTLRSQMEASQKQLDDTIAMMNSEGEERDRLLANAKKNRDTAQEYIAHGAKLEELLDNAMQDKVEEEAFE